jgi:tRNA(fMet)-specific endonuclease VapC
MIWALDTNIVVMALRRGTSQRVVKRFQQTDPGTIVVPEMVRAELLHGCLKSDRSEENLQAVGRFLAPYRRLPFGAKAAEHYAEIRATLERSGETIGPNDLVIAATVRAAGAILVTNNLREFQRVPELECEDWSAE